MPVETAEPNVLRPTRLSDYIGQDDVKGELTLAIRAAKMRKEPLGHVLLYGPPGLGKTTLGQIIATEEGTSMVVASGPSIDSVQKLVVMISNLHYGQVFFIDEIHRLPKTVEEVLYPVLEDSQIYAVMGRSIVSKQLPKFTVVGATTKYAMIAPPLRDRFEGVYRLDYYTADTLQQIVTAASSSLGALIEPEAARVVAERSRGTPRIAQKLLKKCRDYAAVLGDGRITTACATEALSIMRIDEKGMDSTDYRYLRCLVDRLSGGPAGVETLAAACSEDVDTVSNTIEPFLLRIGMIERTPKGRIATPECFEWMFKHQKGRM